MMNVLELEYKKTSIYYAIKKYTWEMTNQIYIL